MTLQRLERVTVENWRSWQGAATLEDLPGGLVILGGPNAVGKSGLWEAIVLGLLDRHWGKHTDELRPAGTRRVIPRIELDLLAGGEQYRIEKHFGGPDQKDRATFWRRHAGKWVVQDQGEEAYRLCRQVVLGTGAEDPGRGGVDRALQDTLMQVLLPRQGSLLDPIVTPQEISLAVTDREAATAATRLGRVLERVRREASTIWVGQRDRPRRGTPLQEDGDRLAAIREEIPELEEQAERIRTLVGRLATTSEELAGLGELEERLAEAQELRRQSRTHRERREAAEQAFREADQLATAVEDHHQARLDLLQQEGALATAREQADLARTASETTLARLEEELAREITARDQHAATLSRYGDWMEYESRGEDLQQLHRLLAELTGRIDRVEENERRRIEAEAERAALPLPSPEERATLESLELQLQEARSRLRAGAWSVTGTIPEGLELSVDGEITTSASLPRRTMREVELRGPGGERLDIRAPASDAGEVARLQREIEGFLTGCGLASLEELRKRQTHVEVTLQARIETATTRVADALGDRTLDELRREQHELEKRIQRTEALQSPASERPAEDPLSWPAHRDVARRERDRLQTRVETLGGETGAARSNLEQCERELEEARGALEQTRAELEAHRREHDSDEELASSALETRTTRDQLAAELESLVQKREMAEQVPEDRARRLEQDLDAILTRRSDIDRLQNEITQLRRDDPEGQLARLEAEQARLEPRHRSARINAEALLLLEQTLGRERDRITRAVGGPIQDRVERWVRYLLQDDSQVTVDEDGAPETITTPAGQEVPFVDQSYGTREQVSILHRLAVADLVAQRAGAGVCLMLDDPFGHTDRGRRRRMLEILEAEAEERQHQILIFTCRPEDFAGIGHHRSVGGAAGLS